MIATVALVIVSGVFYTSQQDKPKPKPVTIHKLTMNSDMNSVNKMLNKHFKLPTRKPTIVWQSPKDGSSLSESFLLKNTPKAKQANLFKFHLNDLAIDIVKELIGCTKSIEKGIHSFWSNSSVHRQLNTKIAQDTNSSQYTNAQT